jgi:hypothetical protein
MSAAKAQEKHMEIKEHEDVEVQLRATLTEYQQKVLAPAYYYYCPMLLCQPCSACL